MIVLPWSHSHSHSQRELHRLHPPRYIAHSSRERGGEAKGRDFLRLCFPGDPHVKLLPMFSGRGRDTVCRVPCPVSRVRLVDLSFLLRLLACLLAVRAVSANSMPASCLHSSTYQLPPTDYRPAVLRSFSPGILLEKETPRLRYQTGESTGRGPSRPWREHPQELVWASALA